MCWRCQEGIPHPRSWLSPFRPSWRSEKPACPSAQSTVRHLAGRFWWERSTSRYWGGWDTLVGKNCIPAKPNKAGSHGTSSTWAPSPWQRPTAPDEARSHSGGIGGTPNPVLGVQGDRGNPKASCGGARLLGRAGRTHWGPRSLCRGGQRGTRAFCAWDGGAAAPGLQQPQTWLSPAHLAQVGGGNAGPVQEECLDADPVPVQRLPCNGDGGGPAQPRPPWRNHKELPKRQRGADMVGQNREPRGADLGPCPAPAAWCRCSGQRRAPGDLTPFPAGSG